MKELFDMLKLAVRIKAEMDHPRAMKAITSSDRRRQRKEKQARDRKAGKVKSLKPQAVPSTDNQPNENSRCPGCGENRSKWSPRERTYRCICRRPLRYVDGVAKSNFDRDMSDPKTGGWSIPDSTQDVQRCVKLLGAMLLEKPLPVVKTREELKKLGYGKKAVDEAVRVLMVRQRQLERPGPDYFVLRETMKPKVLEWAGMEMDSFFKSKPESAISPANSAQSTSGVGDVMKNSPTRVQTESTDDKSKCTNSKGQE